MGGNAPEPAGTSSHEPLRLSSWKAIAQHFDRDVRTVRRWERFEGLPVHRHQHLARSSVFAFEPELDAWWNSRQPGSRTTKALPAGQPDGPLLWRKPLTWITSGALVALAVTTTGSGSRPNRLVDRPAERTSTSEPPPERVDPDGGSSSPSSRLLLAAPVSHVSASADHRVRPEARRAYLLGRYHLNRRSGQRLRAREFFEEAIALEPSYAAAFAGLAEAFSRLAMFGPMEDEEAWPRAEQAARRAIELDAQLPEAHVALGLVQLLHHFDGAAARRDLLRALELAPGSADTHAAYALYLRCAGRPEEAIPERLKARDIEPLRLDLTLQLAADFAFARRYDRALAEYRAGQDLEPHHPGPVDGLADTYARLGRHEDAAAMTVRLLRMRQQDASADAFDTNYRREGFPAARARLDRDALDRYAKQPERHAWDLAYTYARLGQTQAALDWLERAYAARDPGVLQARIDPDVDTLRTDPRFQRILAHLVMP